MIKHSEEFKQEAVRIALTSGLSRERVASDLGIGKSTLSKWLSQYRPSDLVSAPQADLARENERLRVTALRALPAAENRVLKEERDILKKHVLSLPKGPRSSSPRNGHEICVYRCLAASMACGDPLPGHARQRTWLSILADATDQHACAN